MTITRDIPERTLFASDEARRLTKETFVFDCLSLYYVLDDPYVERCLEGGVNAVNITIAAEADFDTMIRKMETALEKIDRHPLLMLATSADDCLRAQKEGKLGIVPGTQGGSMIGTDLSRVGLFYRLGLRFIGLAYTPANLFADGCGETRNGGLTFLGKDFIAAVDELPLILDLSHSSHQARAEATEIARAPVCTHSNAYAVNPNDRNTYDETARAIVDKGGAMGLCGLPRSVAAKHPTLNDLMDHCDHYAKLLGEGAIGIGLDFTEAYQEQKTIMPESRRWRTLRPDIFGTVEDFGSQSYPRGLESIALLPNLTQALMDRGYSEPQIRSILGGAWLDVIRRFVG